MHRFGYSLLVCSKQLDYRQLAGSAGVARNAPITNVLVENIASVGYVGVIQWVVVKSIIKSSCFLTLPNLVPKRNCRFYITQSIETVLSGVAHGLFMFPKFIEPLTMSYLTCFRDRRRPFTQQTFIR